MKLFKLVIARLGSSVINSQYLDIKMTQLISKDLIKDK